MIRVARVEADSIAAELAIPPGLAILRINGHEIRDALDLMYYQAEERLEVEAESLEGERFVYEIDKDPGASLGLVPEPDKVRRCTNACPFCFVKGNPKARKLRAGLYVKDDDYRLSFLYGHYVTLTNLREPDWERISEQRLSPLYVSVHATDPEARLRMLKNPRSGDIGAHLDRLAQARIEVHAQVVLCPGLNDGPILERTIRDLYGRGAAIGSLSIVPMGLTEHNADRGIPPLTPGECADALEQIDAIRLRALEERGFGWCYGADELFLQAGRDVPGRDYFDAVELESNGVGAISYLTERVREGLPRLPRLEGRRVVLVTGASLGPSLARLGDEVALASGARVETEIVANTLYGPMVTTAGLLSGADHRAALSAYADHDLALISAQALNDDDLFLDDMSLAALRAAYPKLEIWPSKDIIDVLTRA